eukprot:GFUD01077644.1.p1 GENE.GFUD01077644.1~~GFUD01077644.1.p1  ORF type:complete len:493 (+),score=124.32 GFUD01077644.1:42-1520(+)
MADQNRFSMNVCTTEGICDKSCLTGEDGGICQVRLKTCMTNISQMLGQAGLSIAIVGITSVAGLVSSEVLRDPKNTDQDIPADVGFEFFDVDGNGHIQRGDLEIFLNIAGITDVDEIAKQAEDILDDVDGDKDGYISRQEWRKSWNSVKALSEFKHKVVDDTLKAEMVAKYGKEGPQNIPLYAFGNKLSFYRLPAYPNLPEERPEADCVFFGCPFDASSTYRMGARFGPAAVRRASQMTSFNYAPWIERDFSKMKIYDAGDAAATPFDIMTAMNQVYLYAKRVWNSSKTVIGIGGDHALTWCLLRAARDFNDGQPVALVHLDAHLDTGDEYHGNKLSHGTALRRAMEDGCVDIERSTHIGIHGSMGSADLMKEDTEKGWLTITMDDFVEKGPQEVADIVKERIGDAPTIISFDVDVLEPGECPGIGFPEPGGMKCRELFTFLRALKGINVIGGEVCEFTPEYDSNEVTAHAIAQGAYEIMCLCLDNVEDPSE